MQTPLMACLYKLQHFQQVLGSTADQDYECEDTRWEQIPSYVFTAQYNTHCTKQEKRSVKYELKLTGWLSSNKQK